MTHVDVADDLLHRLQERNPRFHRKAYVFVLSALHKVMEGLHRPRHISGAELSDGVRTLALESFGPTARTVLGHWGIHCTGDLGEVVFALVDTGVLVKEDEDELRDFQDLFDFEEVFELDYPWAAQARLDPSSSSPGSVPNDPFDFGS